MEEKEIKERLLKRLNDYAIVKIKAEGCMEAIDLLLKEFEGNNDDKEKKEKPTAKGKDDN